jgi:hypothetical protein
MNHKSKRCVGVIAAIGLMACGDVDLNGQTATTADAVGPTITGQTQLDATDCRPQFDQFVSIGLWDIGNDASSAKCRHRYPLTLEVDVPDGFLYFEEAKVRLVEDHPDYFAQVAFSSQSDLPNPFTVMLGHSSSTDDHGASKMAANGMIPSEYAALLRDYVDQSIQLLVQVTGSLYDGRTFTTQDFRLPVAICAGCLSYCRSELSDEDPRLGQASYCAGADDRACVDDDC